MLDFPKRPNGLQRRLARKRSNSQSQSAGNSRVVRRPSRQPLPPERPSQAKGLTARSDSTPRMQRQPNSQSQEGRSTNNRDVRDLRRDATPSGQAHHAARPQNAASAKGVRSRNHRPGPSSAEAGMTMRRSVRDVSSSDRLKGQQRNPSATEQRQAKGKASQTRSRTSPLVYLMRLLILGVGIGAIAGTVLSVWDPNLRNPAVPNQPGEPTRTVQQGNSRTGSPSGPQATISSVRIGREMTDVVTKATPLIRNVTDLIPGVFVMDLDNGDYFSFNGNATFSSASMIKLPILIAFFQDVDAGKIKLDEMLSVQQSDIAEGSGEMQYAGVGTQYSALETATNMIITSDNTATNMIIRRLGGIQTCNQRFQQWGLQQTLLRKPLPDLEGTNTTSPKELVSLMALLNEGKLISMKSRDRAFDIMRRTVTDTLLPSVMSPGSTIAHKTGDIGSLVGDVGVVDLPTGRRYAVATMVKRPHNDPRGQDLIRQIAAIIYEHFGGQPVLAPSPTMTPTPAPQLAPSAPGLQPPASGLPQQLPPGTNLSPSGTMPNTAPVAPTAPGTIPGPAMPAPTVPTPVEPGPEAVAPEPVEPEASSEPLPEELSEPEAASEVESEQPAESEETL